MARDFQFKGRGNAIFFLNIVFIASIISIVFFSIAFICNLIFPDNWYFVGYFARSFNWWTSLAPLFLSILLLTFVSDYMDFYRREHTLVRGRKIKYSPGFPALLLPALDLVLAVFTLGISRPFIKTIKTRYEWSRTHYKEDKTGKFGCKAGIIEAFAIGAAALFLLPLVPTFFGLLLVPIKYFEERWEYGNILVPGEDGTVSGTKFIGRFSDYLKLAVPLWFFSVITFGLYGAWARVKRYRWVAENTIIVK
ncbi:MAG: hypothetical protein ACYS8W_08940 [Planctomycetota bacterium]|jgi:uncharacterized membrane protein YjgN (DUF898 family)